MLYMHKYCQSQWTSVVEMGFKRPTNRNFQVTIGGAINLISNHKFSITLTESITATIIVIIVVNIYAVS